MTTRLSIQPDAPRSANALLGRLLAACVLVTSGALLAYAVMVLVALKGDATPPGALLYGVDAAALAFGALGLQALALRPCIGRLVDARAMGEPAEIVDRLAAYAAPRRATALAAVLALLVLITGYVPIGGPIEQSRAVVTNVGAVCAVLAALVLYAAVRLALRPLVEALRTGESTHDALVDGPPTADRLAWRSALAVGVPASASALVVTLIVTAHVVSVDNAAEFLALDTFNGVLGVERGRHESAAGAGVAAEALRAVHVPVVQQPSGTWAVAPRAPAPPTPPFWSIPIALAVAAVASQFGRRIGRSASLDVENAARRMAVVGVQDIRSVTMSIARPRSVPEIRQMALALDTLAATLLRMNEDQKRALTARTEASRVRSFVLASVSHDLRGPLNSVLGFADLLLSGVEGPLAPGQTESLDALSRGGRDLLRLVDDLLEHARLDAARLTLERSPWASVERIVERARVDALDRAKAPLGEITIEGEAGLRVVADEYRLGHALGALAAFALLRPGSNNRVTVRMRGGEPGARTVTVTIRGGGTTPTREALSKMFEPFDFAPTGARAPAGLNLAVSVARGIVDLHGGTVTAAPHDEGGIVLTVTLAAAETPPPATLGALELNTTVWEPPSRRRF